MDENNEYTEIWLNDEEIKLNPKEMVVVAEQKQYMNDLVMGKDKDALKKAIKLEHVLTEMHKASKNEEQRKNGRSQ